MISITIKYNRETLPPSQFERNEGCIPCCVPKAGSRELSGFTLGTPMKTKHSSPESIRLRRQAEDRLRARIPALPTPSTGEEIQRLHQELQVHQIELEIQNEELHQAKDEVDELLERFVDLYDFAPVGYLTLDVKGVIRAANLTGATLLGEERSRLIGYPFKFFLADAQAPFPKFLERVFAGKGPESWEVALRPAGKTPVTVRIEALLSSSGDECRVAIIDLTELREKDLMLLSQNRLAAMGEMINNIAHQWRKPLNILGLTIQGLLLSQDPGTAHKKAVEEVVSKSMEIIKHMSQTIDDFKNYFKPDKETVQFKIRDVLQRALPILEENCSRREIKINIVEQEEIVLGGYPNELLQALLNILINAVDALTEKTVPAPMITVTISRGAKRALVTIADNAGGIPEEIIDRIFDPYVSTKDPDQGTGIGLYLSKTIIEKSMEGTLTVRNIPGGAEFRIEI